MAHSVSAKKRIRQNEKRRVYNKSIRSELKTLAKKFQAAIDEKNKELAKSLFLTTVSKLDKSLKKGVYHKNTIARKKSQCAKLVNSLG